MILGNPAARRYRYGDRHYASVVGIVLSGGDYIAMRGIIAE
jgi:hypothetical protein